MNDDKTGGPAFPLCRTEEGGINDCLHTGMMLRDYFASQALPSIISLVTDRDFKTKSTEEIAKQFSTASYLIADAMLQERMNPKP